MAKDGIGPKSRPQGRPLRLGCSPTPEPRPTPPHLCQPPGIDPGLKGTSPHRPSPAKPPREKRRIGLCFNLHRLDLFTGQDLQLSFSPTDADVLFIGAQSRISAARPGAWPYPLRGELGTRLDEPGPGKPRKKGLLSSSRASAAFQLAHRELADRGPADQPGGFQGRSIKAAVTLRSAKASISPRGNDTGGSMRICQRDESSATSSSPRGKGPRRGSPSRWRARAGMSQSR